jgi:uncharacterized delta-60 repeat protein
MEIRMFFRSRLRPSGDGSCARRHPKGRDARGQKAGGRDVQPFELLEGRRLLTVSGIGLSLSGPAVTPEGDYTLHVSSAGSVSPDSVTVDWGDGVQNTGSGVGDYVHSLDTGGNYEGDATPTDYTITTQAVGHVQSAAGGNSFVSDAVVDGSGRLITVGGNTAAGSDRWEIRRFNANGTPDTTFGTGGLETLDFGPGVDNARAVALDASGRIVVAGSSGSVNQFIVARLTTGGTPDSTFGPGSIFGPGIVTTPVGLTSGATSVAIQPDGKIVVGGNSNSSSFALARYLSTGALDSTFGIGGTVTTAVGGVNPLSDIALQTSGATTVRIVAVGTGSAPSSVVAAYTAAGALDTTFDGDGLRSGDATGTFSAVAVEGDGSVVIAGDGDSGKLKLLKLTSAGAPATGFGTGGQSALSYQPLPSGVTFQAKVANLLVQDDLSLVVGGTLNNPNLSGPDANSAGLAIFHVDSAGGKDASFGSGGVVYTPRGSSSFGASPGGSVAPSGDDIVQAGTVQNGSGANSMAVFYEAGTFAVSVTNVAPTDSFAPTDPTGDEFNPPSNLTTATPGQVAWFAVNATDPSLVDDTALTYTFDWGDGTSDTVLSGATYIGSPSNGFPLYMPHFFQSSGPVTVKLSVADDDGGVGTATFTVNVALSSGVVADPSHPGQTAEFLAAPQTTLNNKIMISSSASATQIVVDGVTTLTAHADRVVVYGNYGDDTIQVTGVSAAAVELYGGPGDDKLHGGNLDDVVVGGAGDDMLVSGTGRNFLIGGPGADKVIGDSSDDILIGGIYIDADNRDATAAVMAEWTSANPYATRVNNLRFGGGANGDVVLAGYSVAAVTGIQTVFDDGAADKLTGNAGSDWFFANVDGAVKDKITDLTSSEFTDSDRAFVAAT